MTSFWKRTSGLSNSWKDISALTSAIRKNGVTRRHSSHVSFGICSYWPVLLRLVRITEMNPAAHTTNRNSLNVMRSEEHTSELQSRFDIVCRLLLEKKTTSNIVSSTC